MGLLQSIRRNETVNRVVRNFLNRTSLKSANFFEKLIGKWWTSGELDCKFKDVNFKLYNSCDDGMPEKFFYDIRKWHDHGDLFLLMELAKQSKCVVDIGANTGVYSTLAALSNPQATIYAFEPYYINAERLQKNVGINKVTNVELIPEAVGNYDGDIEINIPTNRTVTQVSSIKKTFSENFGIKKTWEPHKVNITTLDSFAKKINRKIDLIKCDVETYEMPVFEGMKEVLKKDKPVVIFETFLKEKRIKFFNELIKEVDYYAYMFLEDGLVYNHEGMYPSGVNDNYLITPVKPKKTFISYNDKAALAANLFPMNVEKASFQVSS